MEDKIETKKNASFENRIFAAVIVLIPLAADGLSLLDRRKGKECPWTIFLIVLCCMLFVFVSCIMSIWNRLRAMKIKYNQRKAQLLTDAAEDDQKKSTLYYHTEMVERKYMKRKRRYIQKILPKCLIRIALIVLFFMLNPNNTKAFWNGVICRPAVEPVTQQHQPSAEEPAEPPSEDSESQPDSSLQAEHSQSDTGDASSSESVSERPRKPASYRFVLADPSAAPKAKERIINQVYFYETTAEANLIDYISTYFESLSCQKKAGTDYQSIQDEKGNTFSTYAVQEQRFKKKAEAFADMEYLDEWNQNAPNSADMDKLIEGRSILNAIETDGASGCYELWWRLANDYQYYAQEYEFQTQNQNAILYYYTMSIYCCMEALKYDLETSDYTMIYYYMIARYRDLASEESHVPEKYKNRTEEILSALDP